MYFSHLIRKCRLKTLEQSGLNPDKVIIKWNKVWLPLEATVLGKNSFVESWDSAIKRYKETLSNNERAELVEISEAARIFPPTSYSDTILVATETDISKIKEETIKDLDKLNSSAQNSIENEYNEILAKYPSNTYIRNKLAIHFYSKNQIDKASTQLKKVLEIDPENNFALINLANILFKQSKRNEAKVLYLKAYELNNKNIGIILNLTRLSLADGNKSKATEYFKEAAKLNPNIGNEHPDLNKATAE